MKLVDIGNNNDGSYCIEFDKKPSLEDAARAIADEYKEFTGSEVYCRGPMERRETEVYYLLEREPSKPELEVRAPSDDSSPVFEVRAASFASWFKSFHGYLQAKHCPDSEE